MNGKKPLVSIIILNYNGLKYLKKCLATLRKVNYSPVERLVVDNGSKDGSADYIRKRYPEVQLIANKKNLNFCKGNNMAFKRSKGKYILFLNNDTELPTNFLAKLVNKLEQDKSIGVVQPKLRKLRNKDKLDAACSFLTNTGFLYHYGYAQNEKDPKFNQETETYTAKGACFLTRRKLIEKIGLFDEDFKAYFEETDFCHRVWLSGSRIIYEPKAHIYHLGGADNKQNPKPEVQFDSYKNRISCYIKNLGAAELARILPLHMFLCIIVALAYFPLGKHEISVGILKAILWNIKNLPLNIKKRQYIQSKIRTVPDGAFLPKIKKNPKLYYYYHFLTNAEGKYEMEQI